MKKTATIRNNFFSLLVISLLFFGCNSKKYIEQDILMRKMIKDYSKTEYFNNYDVYEIEKLRSYNDIEIYYFMNVISPYTPILGDTVGGQSYMLPTNYKKYRGKIFFWKGKDSIITKNLLKEIKKNAEIDSTFYKKALGIEIDYDSYPKIYQDDSKAYFSYFVCKKNNFVLGSQYSSFSPKNEEINKLDCTIKKDNFKEIFPKYMNLLYPPN